MRRTTPRRGGIVRGFLNLLCLMILGAFLFAFVNRKGNDRPHSPNAPSPSPLASTPATPPERGPLPVGLSTGDHVEVTGFLVCDTLDLLRSRPSNGNRPAGARNGKDVFGGGPGDLGVITALEPNAVQFRYLEGRWKGRAGWVHPDEVRKPPTQEVSDNDVIRGLTQKVRRQIYRAAHVAGMSASNIADMRFPLTAVPRDPDAAKRHLAEHRKLYQKLDLQGDRAIMNRFKIDRAQLDAIEKEGDEKKWPLGEG